MPVLFTQLNPGAATAVIERLWLPKCQGRDSSLNLYHGPSLLGKSQLPCQGLSSQPHLLPGASPTAEPQQESRPRSTGGSVVVPPGQTCLAHLHCLGPRHRALSSIQHPHPASPNPLLPPPAMSLLHLCNFRISNVGERSYPFMTTEEYVDETVIRLYSICNEICLVCLWFRFLQPLRFP